MSTSTPGSVQSRLQINIYSIVIGALIFIIIRFWCETIAAWSDNVTKKRKRDLRQSYVSTLFITFLTIFLIFFIYYYATHNGHP
jgi:hypothetical protein